MKKYYNETKLIEKYGREILDSDGMHKEKSIPHHGQVTVYDHTMSVASLSLRMSRKLHINVDEKSLVRGALLHDYYLYNRYEKEKGYETHRFHHPETAYKNASRDFTVNELEKDIILKHMFPWIIKPPKYRETVIVSLADKICATKDYLSNLSQMGR